MKCTGNLGVSLFLLIALSASPLPSFGQQAKTAEEHTAYMAVYEEKDPVKKAEAGEKFISGFKESELLVNAHTLTVGAYAAAKNWAKTVEAADRAAALPNADNKLKVYVYSNAMLASQQQGNLDRVISYGDKVLEINPDDLNTMIVLASVIPAKLPADEAGKNAALNKVESLANKALPQIQGLAAKADAATKPQFDQIEGNLYSTMGLVAYNRQQTEKSIEWYEKAVGKNSKDDVAHFYLGLNHQSLAAKASETYRAAVDEENRAKQARADQPTLDELAAKRGGLEDDTRRARDHAIDEFAISVAIGGPVAAQARDALTKLWTSKNDSTAGMEEFITEKKQQLK
jgi:tetratricopeptide (TPR) repeat protein